VTLKFDSVFSDFAKSGERENLKAAGIREHRPIPSHEAVEATHHPDEIVARTEMKVVRICEDHCRAHLGEIVGIQRFYGC
jgi:hypothetical protein